MLTERFTLFVVIVAFLDAIPKTFERSGLVGVRAVNENTRRLPLQTESEVYIAAEAVWDIFEAVFVELVINLWIRVLEHMLFALKNTKHRAAKSTWTISHKLPPT